MATGVDQEFVEQLRQELRAVEASQRSAAVVARAETLAAGDHPGRLVALLASSPDPVLRHLTVELAARLAAPLDPTLLPVLRYLLNDKDVPEPAKLALAGSMLRTTGGTGSEAMHVLGALVAGMRKADAIERLRRLERTAGPFPVIDQLCTRFEEKLMVHCPRCSEYLSRPNMIQHLWEAHRLVVDGQSVREPWRLIEDWVEACYQKPNPELLVRCRELAQRADPEKGLSRLHRLLLAHHIDDSEARQSLLAEARRQQASLCPHCFALVQQRVDREVKPLNVSRGRLTTGGYRVEVAERGLFTTLEIETPRGMIHKGREPRRRLTANGALVIFTGPLILLALALAVFAPWPDIPVLLPVSVVLIVALVLAIMAELRWRAKRDPFERATDYAWSLLVPTLHAGRFDVEDAGFIAGLALISVGHGYRSVRADPLWGLIETTEAAVSSGKVSAGHVGALWRLSAADCARGGGDAVPMLAEQAARAFKGELPTSYLDDLLMGSGDWLDTAQQARLRVRLCDVAFEAGYEVRDLLELARLAPALASAIVSELPDALAQLRLLWSLRRDVPWASCGSSTTAFELAEHADAGAKHLGKHPDLLITAWEVPGGYLCAGGVMFHDTLIAEFPRSLEVKARQGGGGFDLLFGEHRFWFREDPEMIVVRLESWLRYYFHEFQPQVADVHRWRPHGLPEGAYQFQVVTCRECERRLIPRPGEVGVRMSNGGGA